MSRYVVRPSGPLEGVVPIAGASKNSGCKLMAAALLAPGTSVLRNLPNELSIEVVGRMLRMESVQKEALDHIENTLRTEFVSTLTQTRRRDPHTRPKRPARLRRRAWKSRLHWTGTS